MPQQKNPVIEPQQAITKPGQTKNG